MGHMPYRQWDVFRATHLIVVTSAADPEAGELADRIAAALVARLPQSKALAAEARDAPEVIQLLRSHQLPVALLDAEQAYAAYAGIGEAGSRGPTPLRTLASLGSRLLVVCEDFPGDKAFDIAGALTDLAPASPRGASGEQGPDRSRVPFHPGALAFYEGRSAP
jgi:TRAP-type uncharacterized transport system substrate-binding protein